MRHYICKRCSTTDEKTAKFAKGNSRQRGKSHGEKYQNSVKKVVKGFDRTGRGRGYADNLKLYAFRKKTVNRTL